jgi:hypothetical protein
MHTPAFADEGKAKSWVDGGGTGPWIKHREPREGFMSRRFIVKKEESAFLTQPFHGLVTSLTSR